MAERITYKRVEASAESLNRRLERHGSEIRWRPERRYGYVALDRYRGDACLSTVRVGTSREMYELLYAAMNALDDAEQR